MTNLHLKIVNQDRIGLVLDISKIVSKYQLNITYFSVLPSVMYLEVADSNHIVQQKLIDDINRIEQVVSVTKDEPICGESVLTSPENYDGCKAETAFSSIIHHGQSMKKLIQTAQRAAQSSSTILLLGESGTGKELFAKAIHHASPRSNHKFLPINCGAIPESLLESELFGYDGGAFTGANKQGKKGLFEVANKGTLFLDEIGELPMPFQVKLLRVLQEKKIKRVGGSDEIPIDVRIIAATHQDLNKKMRDNQFRLDLFYRLNVLPLYIPPLRDRQEDIAALAQALLQKKCQQLNIIDKHFAADALDKLAQHPWPGNIRELDNIIERLIHFSPHDHLHADDIELGLSFNIETGATVNSYSAHETISGDGMLDKTLKAILDDCERTILCDAIRKYGTSRQIGKQLGISHTAVLNRIRKYNINIRTEAC